MIHNVADKFVSDIMQILVMFIEVCDAELTTQRYKIYVQR